MRSMWQTWVIFGVCLALVMGTMGWVSQIVTRMDERDVEARRHAELEEDARLVLWRMDAQVATLLAKTGSESPDSLMPPLAGVRFVYHPASGMVVMPEAGGPGLEPEERERLTAILTPARLAAAVARTHPPAMTQPVPILPPMTGEPPEEQALRGLTEWRARQRQVQRHLGPNSRAVWLEGQLIWLHEDPEHGLWQGTVLDWPRLYRDLQTGAHDLLPAATLVPAPDGDDAPRYHLLATLPVCLVPGDLGFYYQPQVSSTKMMILVAWSCMILPAVGLGILLLAMATLSERRASYVSAVTHELRTPLATLRMYADMLAGGMVPAERLPLYLQTLQREAVRLSYLVDNVLTYARLERGKSTEAISVVAAAVLIERLDAQLRERATRAGMELAVNESAAVRDQLVLADPAAVERILINLVDNACKYAGTSEIRRIELLVEADPAYVRFQVRDFGPGITPRQRKKLFRPFSRLDEAHASSGLGLGLALSRKLARRMGGDLQLAKDITDGAAFVLTLPAAEAEDI